LRKITPIGKAGFINPIKQNDISVFTRQIILELAIGMFINIFLSLNKF